METDWFVPLVRDAHPELGHEAARAAVAAAWTALREQAELDRVPVADADEAAVRRRLGLPATAQEAAGGGAGDPVVVTALRVARAAARAYGG